MWTPPLGDIEDWNEAYPQIWAALQQWESRVRATSTDDTTQAYNAHQRMTEICLQLNKVNEAWDHAVVAYHLARQSKDITRIGTTKRSLGDIITRLGHAPDEAFADDPDIQYEGALLAFRTADAHIEIARTLLARGQSLLHRAQQPSAALVLRQASLIFAHLGFEEEAAQAEALRARAAT